MSDERWFTCIYFEPLEGPAKYLSLEAKNRSDAVWQFQQKYSDFMLVSVRPGIGYRPPYPRVRT